MAKIYKAKLMSDTKVCTGKVRLSYPHLFEKYDKSDKYQCQLIISKDDEDTLNCIKKAITNAKASGKASKWGGKIPSNLRNPLNDGDGKEDEGRVYSNAYYINAKSNRKPQVVDKDRSDIFDPDEVYPGCYVRVTLVFYPYDNSGAGIGALLNNVQKIEDGEPLGGTTSSADDDFADDEDLTDDDLLG